MHSAAGPSLAVKKEAEACSAKRPCPPPGYAFFPVDPSDCLLELTISNKCGQAFRWRSVQVWDQVNSTQLAIHKVASHEELKVKKEPVEDEAGPLKSSPSITAASSVAPSTGQTEWSLCLSDRVVFVRQDIEQGYIYHRTLLPSPEHAVNGNLTPVHAEINSQATHETAAWLSDYLSLRVPVAKLMTEWSARDPIFAKHSPRFTGLRMLRQDPWECLCAFICSSNNNIARISQMVSKLCTAFTSPLLEYTYPPTPATGGADPDSAVRIVYHPFPSAARLAQADVEQRLRELGFGYRAKYIATTAKMLCEAHTREESIHSAGQYLTSVEYDALDHSRFTLDGILPKPATKALPMQDVARPRVKRRKTEPNNSTDVSASDPSLHSVTSYLASLRTMDYTEAREHLIQFPGIGPKVADCILLMSLDQPSSIPVDRHVFSFAEKYYGMRGASNRGHKGYEDVAKKLREVWGPGWSGWAHSVLFTAQLRSFASYEQPSLVKKEEEQTRDLGEAPLAKPPLLKTLSAPALLSEERKGLSKAKTVANDLPFVAGVSPHAKGTMTNVSLADRVKGRRSKLR
ncbi:8-oxoguanine glycosylase ogg1 [Tilletia horrida]|nr:8-oxoguanine glycosylase ogg1 [Tilletia horrida]